MRRQARHVPSKLSEISMRRYPHRVEYSGISADERLRNRTRIVFFTFSACQGLPHFSPSGAVRGVTIGDRLSSAAIQVKDGDEIRWTNKLMTAARITFLDYVSDQLSCRSNFEGHFYSGADALLQPNESASLCFYKPGPIRYIVRMEIRDREITEAGQVQVEPITPHPFRRNQSAAVPSP